MPDSDMVSTENGSKRPLVLAIVGPTCTGKTALSLALAQKLDGEIIACDSRTVYRHMDIGTAKPTPAEQASTPHHLIDVVDPNEIYTAAQFAADGKQAITGILSRQRIPVVCGGTGFYARALLEGLSIPPVPPVPELRAELIQLAEQHGSKVLHDKLAELDADSARRINPNDCFRLVRALEVCLTTGRPFSAQARRTESPYEIVWLGLTINDRSVLRSALERRFVQQLNCGLVEEVEFLWRKYGQCQSLANTVNYKEFIQHFTGQVDRARAEELCMQHNYQLARRQLIWFRANKAISWFPVDELSSDHLLMLTLELVGKSAAGA